MKQYHVYPVYNVMPCFGIDLLPKISVRTLKLIHFSSIRTMNHATGSIQYMSDAKWEKWIYKKLMQYC
jgi:hypothetical protein